MMCRFILDIVPNFKIFGKVKIQHGRQNVIKLTYSQGDWLVQKSMLIAPNCAQMSKITLRTFLDIVPL